MNVVNARMSVSREQPLKTADCYDFILKNKERTFREKNNNNGFVAVDIQSVAQ